MSDIPELDLELVSAPVVARPRKCVVCHKSDTNVRVFAVRYFHPIIYRLLSIFRWKLNGIAHKDCLPNNPGDKWVTLKWTLSPETNIVWINSNKT